MKTLATPVQNVKLYTTNESSSNNEIEEQLPQMMRFFDSENRKMPRGSANVIQYQLDLSEGFVEKNRRKNTRR